MIRLTESVLASRPLVVLVGPTAVGKSDVGLRLARALETDLLTADSRQPVQRAANGASPRDESLLSLIASRSDAKTGAFDPVAIVADLGVISRLASLGYITMRGDACTLTDTGAERARLVAKRA